MPGTMEKKNGRSISGGVSFVGFLLLILITLKLAGVGMVATWSWWWVLCPLWAVVPLCLLVLIIWLLIFIIKLWQRERRK
ncbi:MAG: hypothetical protein LBB41_06670 [Prevotellaceae bacterium]|nr:hypothetical protein [Prevotellaceae bacterium]